MARVGAWFSETAEGYAAVLRSDNLRRSQIAWAGAITAEWAFFVGLGVFAFAHGGALSVGLVGLIRMLPSALVAPFASLLGDRYRRDRVVLGLFLAMGAAAGIAGLVAFADPPVAAIYAMAAVHGAASTLSRSAQWSLLPSLARTPEELVAANGATLTTENVGTLVGPAFGGLVLAVSTPAAVFASCAAVYLLSSLALIRLRFDEDAGVASSKVNVRELVAGFPALVGDGDRALIVGLFFAQAFIRGALNVFLVVASLELLGLGDSGVGFLTGALGVGGLVGAFASVTLTGRRLAGPFAAGLVLWGLPLIALAVWPEAWAGLLMMAILGAGNSVLDVAGLTLLQRLVPNEVLTRALGVFWGFAIAMMGVGSIVTSALIAVVGVREALVVTGAFLPLLTLLAWRRLRRVDRTVDAPREQLAVLGGVPMFAPLSVVAKERLAGALVALDLPQGSHVIREGDHGERFFILVEGEVEVSRDGQVVAVRRAPDYFGEIALLRDVPRTATVRAMGNLRLYTLEREDFLGGVTGGAATRAGEAVVGERLAAFRTI